VRWRRRPARLKADAAEAKKAYDGKVTTLRVGVRRLERILMGEHVDDPDALPLFDQDGEEDGDLVPANSLDVLHEQLRARLAAQDIHVTLEQVRGWSAEPDGEYDQVVKYVSALEDDTDAPERPTCLPASVEAARQATVSHQKKTRRRQKSSPTDGVDDERGPSRSASTGDVAAL
jgi:hypothetical protein